MLNDQTMKEVYAPFISIVSAPPSCVTPLGKMILEADVDLTARLLFMQKMHKTHPGTGAVCTAAAIRIPGSIPHRLLRRSADTRTIIHIGYPAGIMDVESVSHMEAGTPVMDKLAFYRTARTIMDGLVYVPFCRLAD